MSESCRFESEVLHAVENDRWTDSLRNHLAGCDECGATAAVAPWMNRFAKISDREHILPDPSVVWLKAKLLQGTIEAKRASRPLDLIQLVAYIAVAGGWAALLTSRWGSIEAWMRSFTPAKIVTTASAPSLSMSFFAIVFVLASMTVMLALHTILAEE